MRIRTLTLIAIQFAACCLATASEWRYFAPILSNQVRPLSIDEATTVLSNFCEGSVHVVEKIGPTCSTRKLGDAFAEIVDRMFGPKRIIFGHFLGPASDDAAISGSGAETHPNLWGGTLLLTKRNGSWVPVWYRSAMITDSCEKELLRDRREILLCEVEDGGMGHYLHYLYTADFKHPADSRRNLIAEAESFEDSCFKQTQVFRTIRWIEPGIKFLVEIDTTVFQRMSDDPACAEYLTRRPARSVKSTFVITPLGIRKEAETSAKGK